ncbi:MAG: hypothetical protein NC293_00690 [Roseburia sp.]|nr:hypothetical protein [Roseburia sp.]
MSQHGRKMIAPVLIAVLFVLYYAGLAVCLVMIEGISIAALAAFLIIPAILAAVMIGVTVSRIKEIRSGEEDDLSKY